tara:strand:+ start:9571 stop:10554 length:984 start_codon:yes stop_codon:yes gene_type:complete
MKKGFWEKLNKPLMVLAPMADVTDPPYRAIIARRGKPDVMFTEFVSCDGLQSVGKKRILKDIVYAEEERPIVLQIFGGKPENFKKTAQLAQELGFDGIDLNMGCPDRSVEKQLAGAGLIKNPELAQEIIKKTMEGAGDLPVSVKTRIGYNTDEIQTWIPKLLEMNIPALTVHLRTRKEMSKVPAHWEKMKEIVAIRDGTCKDTLILGNGDALSIKDAHQKVKETGCDGVMLGRAIYGNPWLFSKDIDREDLSHEEILRALVEHTKLYDELMGGLKSFAVMKRHFKAYVNGFDGAKELRMELMEADSAKEVEEKIENFLTSTKTPVIQ